MDFERLQYEGHHTVHIYAHPYLGMIKLRPLFSKRDQSVYLFPGTLDTEGNAIGYNPAFASYGTYKLIETVPTKPVKAFLNKQAEASKYVVENASFIESVQRYLQSVGNAYYVRLIVDYLQMMLRHEPVGEERIRMIQTVIRELQKSNPNSLLDVLLKFVSDYYTLSKVGSSLNHRDKVVQSFVNKTKELKAISLTRLDELQKQFDLNCETAGLDKKKISEFFKAKVVGQVMFITEIIEQIEFYTISEIRAVIQKYRPDIGNLVSLAILDQNIRVGLRRLMAEDFVERNLLLNTYSLNLKGKALMFQLIEQENNTGLQ
jgi:hypothetical protein